MNKCVYSDVCGGCNYQGLSYAKQLKLKQEYIDSLFNKIIKPNKIIGCNNPLNYRNKVQVSFSKDERNRVYAGNYVANSHIVVPINECMISDSVSIEIINSIVRLINKYKISIFDENVYKGCFRHVLIRSTSISEYMVVLVTGSFNFNKKEEFIRDLIKYNPLIKTIVQNHNNKHTSMVLGDKNTILYGNGHIYDELCGNRFVISPNSFYQINKYQTEVLYKKAIEIANLKGNEVLIDAYCGTGTIGIVACKYVKKVIGVEINESSIKDAYKNLKNNKIKNYEIYCDDAGNFMRRLSLKKQHIDTVIMDPPRSGSDTKFLLSLVKLSPNSVVYVSCNPETLLRDSLFLLKKGYIPKVLQPIDMFPYTNHVESIMLLEKH